MYLPNQAIIVKYARNHQSDIIYVKIAKYLMKNSDIKYILNPIQQQLSQILRYPNVNIHTINESEFKHNAYFKTCKVIYKIKFFETLVKDLEK